MGSSDEVLCGTCLCGQVRFALRRAPRALYQCHCSLCRKQGGSASNTAAIVAARDFRWISGEDSIRSWVKESGFRSDFCAVCGSPLPNPLRALPYVWVPAGLIDGDFDAPIRAQLCVASKAAWDPLAAPGVSHASLPDFPALLAQLCVETTDTHDPPDAPHAD